MIKRYENSGIYNGEMNVAKKSWNIMRIAAFSFKSHWLLTIYHCRRIIAFTEMSLHLSISKREQCVMSYLIVPAFRGNMVAKKLHFIKDDIYLQKKYRPKISPHMLDYRPFHNIARYLTLKLGAFIYSQTSATSGLQFIKSDIYLQKVPWEKIKCHKSLLLCNPTLVTYLHNNSFNSSSVRFALLHFNIDIQLETWLSEKLRAFSTFYSLNKKLKYESVYNFKWYLPECFIKTTVKMKSSICCVYKTLQLQLSLQIIDTKYKFCIKFQDLPTSTSFLFGHLYLGQFYKLPFLLKNWNKLSLYIKFSSKCPCGSN